MKNILTIAGSDSSAGAGIQGDIKTIAFYGYHGLTAITAVTSQNSKRVSHIQPIDVQYQLEALAETYEIAAIKIGMLYTTENILAVGKWIEKRKCPIVLDPIICSSTGQQLLQEEALKAMKKILPKVSLITPNRYEAEILTGNKISAKEDVEQISKKLYSLYKTSVLLKGGHFDDPHFATDFFYDGIIGQSVVEKRIKNRDAHGTGCCLSSALACELASGQEMKQAIMGAKETITRAIRSAYSIGEGGRMVNVLRI